MSFSKPEKVGELWVDSGCIMVGDPCYLWESDSKLNKGVGTEWSDFCGAVEEAGFYDDAKRIVPLAGSGIALVASSGYGDGSYPVYAEYNDEGRVARLTIEFINQKEDDSW